MKRSEALAIIWEAINELEDADHILTRLETAGMLPPKRVILEEQWVTEDGIAFLQGRRFHRSWEPENE